MRLIDVWNRSTLPLKACSLLILAVFVPWTVLVFLAYLLLSQFGADAVLLRVAYVVLVLLAGLNAASALLFLVSSFRSGSPRMAHSKSNRDSLEATRHRIETPRVG